MKSAKNDVDFRLEGGVEKSGDLQVTLHMRNVGTEGRVVDIYMGVYSTYYTGVSAMELKKNVTNMVVEARTGRLLMFIWCVSRGILKRECVTVVY